MEDDESEDQDRETIGQRVRLLSIHIYLFFYVSILSLYVSIHLSIFNWTSGESLIHLFIYLYIYLFMYIKMPITPIGQRPNHLSMYVKYIISNCPYIVYPYGIIAKFFLIHSFMNCSFI